MITFPAEPEQPDEVLGLGPLGEAALALAAQGFPVFPCKPRGKIPLTDNGVKDTTTDHDRIVAWWQKWSQTNVAIALGGPSGIIALDIDRHH